VLRVEPPLTITRPELERFVAAVDATCREIDYSTRLIDNMICKASVGDLDQRQPDDVSDRRGASIPE
jgi:hypothetical protein